MPVLVTSAVGGEAGVGNRLSSTWVLVRISLMTMLCARLADGVRTAPTTNAVLDNNQPRNAVRRDDCNMPTPPNSLLVHTLALCAEKCVGEIFIKGGNKSRGI